MKFYGFVFLINFVFGSEIDDKVQYHISWPGPLNEKVEDTRNFLTINTADNEQYQCFIPDDTSEDKEDEYKLGYEKAEFLISHLLKKTQQVCSLRLEPYWTYSVCHGDSIAQYHEESSVNEDGVTKMQRSGEFLLGSMTPEEKQEFVKNANKDKIEKEPVNIRTKRLNNQDTPYFSLTMGNGDPCDLTGEPRTANVLYICHPSANNEVLSIKEVTTCRYEVVVLSPDICKNPNYKLKKKSSNGISCHSLNKSPKQPSKLLENSSPNIVVRNVDSSRNERAAPKPTNSRTHITPAVDTQLNKLFLEGSYCLTGGSGWWQYEFCNGKHIDQFHVEPNKKKTVVKLGYFNKDTHIKWYKEREKKASKHQHVTHLYTGGDICDLTGKPRLAFVYLVCREGKGQKLVISMVETATCEYKVTVESPILCPLIQTADQNGLFVA